LVIETNIGIAKTKKTTANDKNQKHSADPIIITHISENQKSYTSAKKTVP